MTPEDVKYWMNQTCTSAVPQEPKRIDLAAMVKAMGEAIPQEYMLIDPKGRVFKGPDPLILAAQARHREPWMGETSKLDQL